MAGLTAGSAFAQQTESRIIGRLVDDSQGALPGATVNVTSRATGVLRSVVTETDGTYAVTNLAPGAYTVQAELSGFGNQTRETVLGVGQVETIDMTLGVAGLTETVAVTTATAAGRACASTASRTSRITSITTASMARMSGTQAPAT
jgi:hypothetical protein